MLISCTHAHCSIDSDSGASLAILGYGDKLTRSMWQHAADLPLQYLHVAVALIFARMDGLLAHQTWIQLLRHCPGKF